MPGDTPLTYPFPYKTTDGSEILRADEGEFGELTVINDATIGNNLTVDNNLIVDGDIVISGEIVSTTGFKALDGLGGYVEMTNVSDRGIIRTASDAGLDLDAQGSGKSMRLMVNDDPLITITEAKTSIVVPHVVTVPLPTIQLGDDILFGELDVEIGVVSFECDSYDLVSTVDCNIEAGAELNLSSVLTTTVDSGADVTVAALGLVDITSGTTTTVTSTGLLAIIGLANVSMTGPNVLVQATGLATFQALGEGNFMASGVLNMDSGADMNISSAALIDMEATTDISITSGALFTIDATGVLEINGTVDVNISSETVITLDATTDISITAAALMTLSATGELSIEGGADVNISSITAFTVEATTDISLTAAGLLDINSTGALTIDGTADVSITAGGILTLSAVGDVVISGAAVEYTFDSVLFTIATSFIVNSGGIITLDSVGTLNLTSAGEVSIEAGGLFTVNATGDITIDGAIAIEITAVGAVVVSGGGDLTLDSGIDVNIEAGGGVEVSAVGVCTIEAGGDVNITGGVGFTVEAAVGGLISTGAGMALTSIGLMAMTSLALGMTLTTGAGAMLLTTGAGDMSLSVGTGAMTLSVGAGGMFFTAASGTIDMTNIAGNISISTGVGAMTLTTLGGAFLVTTGAGSMNLTTGAGDMTLTVGGGAFLITTGAGELALTTGAGSMNLTTGAGDMTLTLGGGAFLITTGAGELAITTGAGSMNITTGAGDMTLTVGGGAMLLTVGGGTLDLTAAGGDITLTTGGGACLITTGAGDLSLTVGAGVMTLTTGAGGCFITTGAGVLSLTTGAGAVTITSGALITITTTVNMNFAAVTWTSECTVTTFSNSDFVQCKTSPFYLADSMGAHLVGADGSAFFSLPHSNFPTLDIGAVPLYAAMRLSQTTVTQLIVTCHYDLACTLYIEGAPQSTGPALNQVFALYVNNGVSFFGQGIVAQVYTNLTDNIVFTGFDGSMSPGNNMKLQLGFDAGDCGFIGYNYSTSPGNAYVFIGIEGQSNVLKVDGNGVAYLTNQLNIQSVSTFSNTQIATLLGPSIPNGGEALIQFGVDSSDCVFFGYSYNSPSNPLNQFGILNNTGSSFITFDQGTLNTQIYSTTNSTSISTGSLVVDGGVGIAKDVYIGGNLNVTGTISGSISIGSITGNSAASLFTVTNNYSAGKVILSSFLGPNSGTNNCELYFGTAQTTANCGLVGFNDSGQYAYFGLYGGTFNNYIYVYSDGHMFMPASISSTSPSTGSLVISGGVGITGDLWVSGIIHAETSLSVTNTASGTVTIGQLFAGNSTDCVLSLGNSTGSFNAVGLDFHFNSSGSNTNTFSIGIFGAPSVVFNGLGNVAFNSTVNATAYNAAAITTLGGVGITQDLWVHGNVKVDGTIFGTLTVGSITGSSSVYLFNVTNNYSTGTVQLSAFLGPNSGSNDCQLYYGTAVSTGNCAILGFNDTGHYAYLGIYGSGTNSLFVYNDGHVYIPASITSTSPTTGSLVIGGGLGVSGAINTKTIGNATCFLGDVSGTISASTFPIWVTASGMTTGNSVNILLGRDTSSFDNYCQLSYQYNANASNLNFLDLIVGGFSVAQLDGTGRVNLPVNISSTSKTTGTLIVAGGVGISGLTFTDSLWVNTSGSSDTFTLTTVGSFSRLISILGNYSFRTAGNSFDGVVFNCTNSASGLGTLTIDTQTVNTRLYSANDVFDYRDHSNANSKFVVNTIRTSAGHGNDPLSTNTTDYFGYDYTSFTFTCTLGGAGYSVTGGSGNGTLVRIGTQYFVTVISTYTFSGSLILPSSVTFTLSSTIPSCARTVTITGACNSNANVTGATNNIFCNLTSGSTTMVFTTLTGGAGTVQGATGSISFSAQLQFNITN